MPHVKVIVNLVAGANSTHRKWSRISKLLRHVGLSFDYEYTEGVGHAIELAKSAVDRGYELVVAVGGDGTISDVANGIYYSGETDNVILGIVNTGTGGDYIRTFGIPRSYEQACRHLLNAGNQRVDLGLLRYTSNNQTKERIVINFAGLGIDAEIAKATTQRFKTLGSTPSYLLGLLSSLLLHRNKNISLTLDGIETEKKVCSVMREKTDKRSP